MARVAKKITRTWKIEEDVALRLDEWAAKTHLTLGDSVQLGIWVTMSLTPDQRQMLLELMDARREATLSITVEPQRPAARRKSRAT